MTENEKKTELVDIALVDKVTTLVDNDTSLPDSIDVRIKKIHVDTILSAIDKTLEGRSLTKGNVIRVAWSCMSLCNKLRTENGKQLPGALKKEILLFALSRYIEKDSGLNVDDKGLLIMIVHDVVNTTVDVLAESTHGAKCCIIT
jgi:hypothetical protein